MVSSKARSMAPAGPEAMEVVSLETRLAKEPESDPQPVATKVQIQELNFFYGTHQVLRNVSLDVPKDRVTALIGPSGCGKTTLLRCLNRMHDLYAGNRYEGSVKLQPEEIGRAHV